jgi:hypothetical protein
MSENIKTEEKAGVSQKSRYASLIEACEMGSESGAEEVLKLLRQRDDLLDALKGLAGQIQLGKLNIRKDFSLINAHAVATKAIYKAEGK